MSTESYDQKNTVPEADEYRELRSICSLSAKTAEAAAKDLPNTLFATTIRHHGRLIAMGRVVSALFGVQHTRQEAA